MLSLNAVIDKALATLQQNKTILYPTDTVWGIGGNATSNVVAHNINEIKGRPTQQSLIVLLPAVELIENYAQHIDTHYFYEHVQPQKPVTFIFPQAKNIATSAISSDGSIAIRIPQDAFCQTLLKAYQLPLFSTSANIHGSGTPINFSDISDHIKHEVDFVVPPQFQTSSTQSSSMLVKMVTEHEWQVLRY